MKCLRMPGCSSTGPSIFGMPPAVVGTSERPTACQAAAEPAVAKLPSASSISDTMASTNLRDM